MEARLRATDVRKKDHFKEEVTSGLLLEDGPKLAEEEGVEQDWGGQKR